jgi:tRNA-specific 2-thiouridylase
VLGRHEGIHRFTVGQRKGLRLSSSEPLYVVEISAAAHTVTVGPREDLDRRSFEAESVNWISGNTPHGPLRASVQIRHRHEPAAAIVTPLERSRALVTFDEPERAITPGQAAVFYDGDEVLGGGWIASG